MFLSVDMSREGYRETDNDGKKTPWETRPNLDFNGIASASGIRPIRCWC